MRNGLTVVALVAALALAGCSDKEVKEEGPKPVASGTVITATLWEGPPVSGPGSRGGMPFTAKDNAHIDVYDSFVIVTTPDGVKRVAPLEWCSNVAFK